MKKLLTILGSLTIATSGSLMVVSCGTKEDKEEIGETILESLIDPDTGESRDINSQVLMDWYQKNYGMGDSIKQLKEFLQLFAVGIMKETEKGDDSFFKLVAPSDDSNKYALENFQQKLIEGWGAKDSTNGSTVQGAANVAWNKKEEDAKKNDGEKKYKENLINSLAQEFPYVKKDFDVLKKTWINKEILTNTTTGASAKLSEILATNASRNYNYLNNEDSNNWQTLVSSFVTFWKTNDQNEPRKVKDLANAIYNYALAANKDDVKYINLVNLINATGGQQTIDGNWVALPANDGGTDNQKEWSLSKVQWFKKDDTITETLIKDLLYRLDPSYAGHKDNETLLISLNVFSGAEENSLAAKHWSYYKTNGSILNDSDNFFKLIANYPNYDFANQSAQGETIYGMLTNSQRFLVDQYFKTQKPISTSEVVFKPVGDNTLAKDISGQNFIKPTDTTNAWKQFFGFYNFLKNYAVEKVDGANNPAKGVSGTIKGTSQYNFDTIFTQNTETPGTPAIRLNNVDDLESQDWGTDYYTAKNNKPLLTLSTTTAEGSDGYSALAKYSIYDFVQATSEATGADGQHQETSIYDLIAGQLPAEDITAIQNNLVNTWKFEPLNAYNIASSILNNAPNPEKRTESLKGLYATLNLIKALDRKVTPGSTTEFSTSYWKPNDPESTNNQANNKVYQVINSKQGIIAFVDTDGLHITKINGYDILLNPTEEQKTNQLGNGHQNDYINEVNAFKRLFDGYDQNDTTGGYRYIYQDYQNNIADGGGDNGDTFTSKLIPDSTVARLKNYGVYYQDLNTAITNPYERFLVNNSILSTSNSTIHKEKPPLYSFNIIEDTKKAIQSTTDDTLSTNNSWLWDYIKNILDIQADDDLLTKFFKFENDPLSRKTKTWYLKKLELNSQRNELAANDIFRSGWDDWNIAIEKTKTNTPGTNKDLPLMKLAYGTLSPDGSKVSDTTHINKLQDMGAFNPYKKNTKFKKFVYEINFNSYLASNNIALNKKGGWE